MTVDFSELYVVDHTACNCNCLKHRDELGKWAYWDAKKCCHCWQLTNTIWRFPIHFWTPSHHPFIIRIFYHPAIGVPPWLKKPMETPDSLSAEQTRMATTQSEQRPPQRSFWCDTCRGCPKMSPYGPTELWVLQGHDMYRHCIGPWRAIRGRLRCSDGNWSQKAADSSPICQFFMGKPAITGRSSWDMEWNLV